VNFAAKHPDIQFLALPETYLRLQSESKSQKPLVLDSKQACSLGSVDNKAVIKFFLIE